MYDFACITAPACGENRGPYYKFESCMEAFFGKCFSVPGSEDMFWVSTSPLSRHPSARILGSHSGTRKGSVLVFWP